MTIWCAAGSRINLRHDLLAAIAQSCSTILSSELFTLSPPLYSINPSLRNLFMKKFTRERVVLTISASVSWESFGSHSGRLRRQCSRSSHG
jgi:hypothetical protein